MPTLQRRMPVVFVEFCLDGALSIKWRCLDKEEGAWSLFGAAFKF